VTEQAQIDCWFKSVASTWNPQ